MHDEIQHASEQKKNLKHNELFVLDNSLRESTVGQLRGHTIENKWKIYEQVGVYCSTSVFSLRVRFFKSLSLSWILKCERIRKRILVLY